MPLLKKLVGAAFILGGVGAVAGWLLSAPVKLDAETLAQLGPGDAARGKRIFNAGGCTSCHAKPGSQGDARLQLVGGLELKTPFGTFVPPNISQDAKDGIGAWSVEDLANAMLEGVSPSGEHFYPAFPYPSYARMRPADIADLYAFLKTLPAVAGKAPGHSLSFPFSIRRGLGLWKRLYLSKEPVIAFPDGTPDPVMAGRYLVEGPGHCGVLSVRGLAISRGPVCLGYAASSRGVAGARRAARRSAARGKPRRQCHNATPVIVEP